MKECAEYKLLGNRLREYCGCGFGSKFFKNVLVPDWWDDTHKNDQSLVKSLVFHVGKMLGIKPRCFETGSGVFEPLRPANAAYKMRSVDTYETLSKTTAYLQNIAANIVSGFSTFSTSLYKADDVRDKILEHAKDVDLYSLLDFCWSIGVPVISVTIPSARTWHKPQAVTFRFQDKYCIFLLEKNKFQAKYLFPLAHELGHILLGHFECDAYMYDDKDRDAADEKEKDANDFATTLLRGKDAIENCPSSNPSTIARWARDNGNQSKIDAGYLVLSYGFENKKMPSANAALKIINQDEDNGPIALIKSKTYKYLKEDNYSVEKFDMLVKAISLEI